MSSSETATALVVSPTALPSTTRSFFEARFGPHVAYVDLAGLRRVGLGSLRRTRTGTVVATGPPYELPLFGDCLVLLSFFAPGAKRQFVPDAKRERRVPGEEPSAAGEAGRARAILVEPGGVDALVDGIRAAVELSPAQGDALGSTARSLVLESFTWDRNMRTVLARLQELAGLP